MNLPLIKKLTKLMRQTADKLDAGNSHLSESEAMHIMSILCHEELSKAQVCQYLNMSRSNFDLLVRTKQIPKGRKIAGYKELRWYKDEIDECVARIKDNQK